MTGIELIVAALAAGAAAGTSELASKAVLDAYTSLREAVVRRLSGHNHALRLLDAAATQDPSVWQVNLTGAMAGSGIDHDESILAAANALLALIDPGGDRWGSHTVHIEESDSVQSGDGNLHIVTSYGPTANTMTGPVTVTYGQSPLPPTKPATP